MDLAGSPTIPRHPPLRRPRHTATRRSSANVAGHCRRGDAAGRAIVSSRETAYKTRHLRRDPRASLCVFMDEFYGPWVQIDGTAEVVALPDAMELLVDYYRRIAGEHSTGMTTAVLWSVIGACSCASALTALARIGRDRT